MPDDQAQLLACIPRLRRYARALVGDRAGADDLVQDTLERGWQKLASWRHGSDMRAWLFSIMHNLRMDQLRKPVLANEVLEQDSLQTAMTDSQSHGLEIRDLQSALALLPLEQRQIVLLVALEQMTYEEVAQTLALPLGTVMSRLSRGREKLRTLMDGQQLLAPLRVVK